MSMATRTHSKVQGVTGINNQVSSDPHKGFTWICEKKGTGGTAGMQRWNGCRQSPLAPLETGNTSKRCSVCHEKT